MASWLATLILVGSLFGTTVVQAQSYPTRPITIVVTTVAGGITDLLARTIGKRLSEAWGQPVVIENRAGAGHNIGAVSVAKAVPDGYTLMVSEGGIFVSNPALYARSKLPYDADNDFAPISGLARYHLGLFTHPSLPARSVQELIELAKSKPGEIGYGTSGIGTAPHMNIALFENLAGVKLTPIHYRGVAPALNDLIGGHIRLMSTSLTPFSMEPFRAGRLNLLGVGSVNRMPQLPEVPTVAESGVPRYESASWIGLVTTGGTPLEIITKINAEVQRILADPSFRETFFAPQMLEPMMGSHEQFVQYIRSQTQKWVKVIREQKMAID